MDRQLESLASSLESVLRELVRVHEELIGLMKRKRLATRQGQSMVMVELCQLENEKVQLVSELEKKRLKFVGKMTLLVAPDAPEPLRMRELVDRLPEPLRGQLLVLRQQLMDRLREAHQQASVARRSAESLVRHVEGLVQTISAMSSGVCTYGERGSPPQQARVVSTFNMTA